MGKAIMGSGAQEKSTLCSQLAKMFFLFIVIIIFVATFMVNKDE